MKNCNASRIRPRKLAYGIAVMGLAAAMPAFAETEVEALKRELAEQKQLIQKLIANQDSQTRAIAKMETQSASGATAKGSSGTAIPGITFYGTVDVNVASTNSGFGSKTSINSGGMTASSVGVKGQKDLGHKLRAVGEVEVGFDLSTGGVGNGAVTPGVNATSPSSGGYLGNGNQIFSRQAYAGLASDDFGTLTLGRQYTGSYVAAAILGNAFGPGFFGSGATFLPVVGGMPTRVNNSVVYRTPNLSGFSGWLTYTVGSENNTSLNTAVGSTTTTDQAGSGWDLALFYKTGALSTALTSWNVLNTSFVTAGETALARKSGWQAVVNYDFGFVKLYGTLLSGKISGGNYENITRTLSESSGWSTSAAIPFGDGTIIASYSKLDDKSSLNKDGNLIGLAYTYQLVKGTKVYGSYGKLTNNQKASYSLANGGDLVGNVARPGFDPTGYMVGVNSSF
ncbi:porin [Zoogloea sp.]|uniref:porin n=1 Tax=Zoogloea sp. TaxID=49181 RepID=UPI002606F0A6|nr:porin [Zoogloea sp.]